MNVIKVKLKKRKDYKNQIVFEFSNGIKRFWTPPCEETEIPELVKLIKQKIAFGTFKLEDYLPEKKIRRSLKNFINEYLNHRKKLVLSKELSPRTFEHDTNSLKIFLKILGDIPLQSIEKKHIEYFVEKLLKTNTQYDKPYSKTSVNMFLRAISASFSYALQKGYISDNPLLKFPRLKEKKKSLPRYLTDREFEIFQEYFKNKPLWQLHIFLFACNTGLRRDELFNSKFEHVFFDRGSAVHFMKVPAGKGDKERIVPLSDAAMDIIRERESLISSNEHKKIIFSQLPGVAREKALERAKKGFIFFEISTAGAISKMFRRAKIDLNLRDEELNFHSTRHYFATKFLERGGDKFTLQEILGHTTVFTTDIYAKITLKNMAENLKKVERNRSVNILENSGSQLK